MVGGQGTSPVFGDNPQVLQQHDLCLVWVLHRTIRCMFPGKII